MLFLIAGPTGNLGQHLINSLLARGQQVRGLGRNPNKMESSQLARLESFVESRNYYDIEALDRACAGVDCVICAYQGIPELQLDGQLLLLRAVERAGVKRFVAGAFSCDWTGMPLGMLESYDGHIMFHCQAAKTSTIKPIYIFSGAFAEVLFSIPGHGDFRPDNGGFWDPKSHTLDVWGTGEEVWSWTTEKDAAEFTAEIALRHDAVEGGYWDVRSGSGNIRQVAGMLEEAKGAKIQLRNRGTVEDLRTKAMEERKKGSLNSYWDYIGWFYHLYIADGTWIPKKLDNDKLGVATTGLVEFLKYEDRI